MTCNSTQTACQTLRVEPSSLQAYRSHTGKVICSQPIYHKKYILIQPDFDPEEDAPAQETDDESTSGDDNEGAETEHYVAVG